MRLRALSIDREIKDSLAGKRVAGSTLAVYSKAVYLRTDGGPIIVIGRADIGNGPGFILIDHDGSLKDGRAAFCPDERFEIGGGVARFGGGRIIVGLSPAEGWEPAFAPAGIPRMGGLEPCMEIARGVAQSRGRDEFFPAARGRVRALSDALAKGRESAGRSAVRRLIGLGEGLTPSCDDLLVGLAGFLYVASNDPSLGGYAERTVAWLGEELALAGGRTTPIAAHFLAEAGRGRFTERVKDMLEAIFAADEKRMERASERLIEYGATSGTDLMCGMIVGYEAIKWSIVHGR